MLSVKYQKDIRMEGEITSKITYEFKVKRQTDFELLVLRSVAGPLYGSVTE